MVVSNFIPAHAGDATVHPTALEKLKDQMEKLKAELSQVPTSLDIPCSPCLPPRHPMISAARRLAPHGNIEFKYIRRPRPR